MNFVKSSLNNGVGLLTVPMPSLTSATVVVWVKTGSRNEVKRVNGISHFLEHMVFKGSAKRPSAKEISEVVDAIGGEFNASTGKDMTNYYIKSAVGSLETSFDVLSDMVISPILNEEEIEREKGVIIEEIAMYEDTPMYRIGDVFEQLVFDGHKLGWDIAGTKETVKSIKKDDFLKYRQDFYNPDNILVTVAGGVAPDKASDLAEKYFGNLTKGSTAPKSDDFTVSQTKPKLKLYPKKKEQAHFILGFLSGGRAYENRFAQSLISVILGGGMSSRLFTEVRERRGLAYAIRSSVDRYDEIGTLGVYAGVDPDKAEEAIKVILDQVYGLTNGAHRVTEKELTKAKSYLKGHLALSLEDTRDVASFFGEQELFLGKVLTPKDIFEKIEKVGLEDVEKEAGKVFTPKGLNLAIIGPYKNEEKFRKLLA